MVNQSFDAIVNEGYLRVFLLYYGPLNILKKHYSNFDGEFHT